MHRWFTGGAVVALTLGLALIARAADWPQWRGPQRDGHPASPITPPAAAPWARWRVEVGLGHSGPIVVGDRVYQFARRGEREILIALRAGSGATVWEAGYAAPYTMNPAARGHGPGPKSTPAYEDGRIFTLGISGIVSAFAAADGALLWQRQFDGEFDATSPVYGAAVSPIVTHGAVIIHVGGASRGRLTAFAPVDGSTKWATELGGPGYASPIVATLDGVEQLVTQTGNAIVGVSPTDGETLWQMPFRTDYDQNIVTAVVAGETFIVSGLDQGVLALRPARSDGGWSLAEVWRNGEVSLYMSSPVRVGSRLIGLSHRRAGQFFALDVASGETVWTSRGREGDNAAFVVAGETVLALTDTARLLVLPATTDEFAPAAEYEVATSATWAHPAAVPDGLLVKDLRHLALLDLSGARR